MHISTPGRALFGFCVCCSRSPMRSPCPFSYKSLFHACDLASFLACPGCPLWLFPSMFSRNRRKSIFPGESRPPHTHSVFCDPHISTLGTNAVWREDPAQGASECLKCAHIAWKRSGGGHMVRGGCMASGEAMSSEFWAVLDSRRSYVWALRSAAVGR